MLLLTSTAIVLDHMPYEPSAKTFSPVEDELVQHAFFLPPLKERPRHVDSRRAMLAVAYNVLLEQIRTGSPRMVSHPGSMITLSK